MKLSQISVAFVCIASVNAKSKPKPPKDACNYNNLIRCFLSSSALAAPFCSSYIGEVPGTTATVAVQQTNILTKYFTNTIWTVETDTATAFYTTTTTLPAPIFGNAKKPPVSTLKCTKGQAAASISHACSCFESALQGTQTATQTSTTTTTTPITTFITETSTTVTTVAVASATAVVPNLGPICNQRADFIGTDPTAILSVVESSDSNACGLSCQQLAGCISYVYFDYYGLCGLFNVPVSELAGGTGLYTFWDLACPLPPAHVPVCDAPGAPQSGTQVPVSTKAGVFDQAACQAQCVLNSGCLSYSVASGVCVIFGGYVSQWLDPTGHGTIGWDATCPIPSDYCGFTGDLLVAPSPPPRRRTITPTKTPNESGTPAPFAEYCWQLCIADNLCISYTFDPVNLLCAFYSQTVAAIAPTADPVGIQFYDISCPAPSYPNPACGVYALTNAATTAAFVTTIAAVTTLTECLATCLYNCAAILFSVDSSGVATCSQFSQNLAAMVPPPDTTQTTIWYDSTCPLITPSGPLCAYTADPPSTPTTTSAPFAEYCYQLCSADSTCASFYFDPVLLQCALYTTSVAVVAPTPDPNGVQWYDIACAPPAYPNPACGVYASTNAATTASLINSFAVSDVLNCYYNCLYGCVSYSYGAGICSVYFQDLAAMVPPPDTTQTTVFYDVLCAPPAVPT